DRGTERRVGRVDVELSARHLARAEQERHLVARDVRRDDHAGLDDAVVLWRADLGLLELGAQLCGARVVESELLTGGVVAAVLGEVALGAGSGDARHDLVAARTRQTLELGLHPVVRFLGQPRRGLAHHSTPSVAPCSEAPRSVRFVRGLVPRPPGGCAGAREGAPGRTGAATKGPW